MPHLHAHVLKAGLKKRLVKLFMPGRAGMYCQTTLYSKLRTAHRQLRSVCVSDKFFALLAVDLQTKHTFSSSNSTYENPSIIGKAGRTSELASEVFLRGKEIVVLSVFHFLLFRGNQIRVFLVFRGRSGISLAISHCTLNPLLLKHLPYVSIIISAFFY